MKKNNTQNSWMEWVLRIVAFCSLLTGLIILVCFVNFLRQNFIASPNLEYGNVMENTGNVGDFFGGVIGSFWALTGVFLLYLTLKMQKEELVNQRNELQSTREVFEIQKFENTFFNLLNYQNGINSSLKIAWGRYQTQHGRFVYQSKEYLGDDVFMIARHEMVKIKECLESPTPYKNFDIDYYNDELSIIEQQEEVNQELLDADKGVLLSILEKAYYTKKYKITEEEFNMYKVAIYSEKAKLIYGILFDIHENILGHYFRNLYHILKYLDDTQQQVISKLKNQEDITNVKSDFLHYAQFVQSQMTSSKLLIMFYNSINFPKTCEFAQKYKLLENLSSELLLDENHNGAAGIHLAKSKKNLRLEVFRNNTK